MARARRLALAMLAAACGCASSSGHAPVARIAFGDCRAAAPPSSFYVPLGDGYRTDVPLDGSCSDDPLDDPTGAMPLAFHFAIDDPAPQVTSGSLDGARVTVRVAGSRPTAVRLTVTNLAGAAGSAAASIGVTLSVDAGP